MDYAMLVLNLQHSNYLQQISSIHDIKGMQTR